MALPPGPCSTGATAHGLPGVLAGEHRGACALTRVAPFLIQVCWQMVTPLKQDCIISVSGCAPPDLSPYLSVWATPFPTSLDSRRVLAVQTDTCHVLDMASILTQGGRVDIPSTSAWASVVLHSPSFALVLPGLGCSLPGPGVSVQQAALCLVPLHQEHICQRWQAVGACSVRGTAASSSLSPTLAGSGRLLVHKWHTAASWL